MKTDLWVFPGNRHIWVCGRLS